MWGGVPHSWKPFPHFPPEVAPSWEQGCHTMVGNTTWNLHFNLSGKKVKRKTNNNITRALKVLMKTHCTQGKGTEIKKHKNPSTPREVSQF